MSYSVVRRILAAVFVTIIGVTVAGLAASGKELIENGGFEDGTAFWTVHDYGAITVTDREAASGSYSLHMTGRTTTGSGPKQVITGEVEAGKSYRFSAKVKYTEGPEQKQFNYCIQNGPSWQGIQIMGSTVLNKGEWGTIEGVYTLPQGADLSETFIFIETVWTPNPDPVVDLMDFYVDDVSFSEATDVADTKPSVEPVKVEELGSTGIARSYKPIGDHNPLLPHRFGADPYALVYGDRVYVYSTNDIIERDSSGKIIDNTYGKIHTINCISSDDLVNWTDHGWIDIGPQFQGIATWANNSWAPAAAYKNIDGRDRFFLYFSNNANGIGVLTSDSPIGPFVDPIGRPLVSRQTPNANVVWLFDPAIVFDDDGKAYLYFGGGVPEGKAEMPNTARVVQLGDDMVSLAGIPQVVEAPWFFEAAFVHKIGDTFYFSYCTNWSRREGAVGKYMTEAAEIVYMTSKNPMGPWEFQGSILKNPGRYFGTWGNNHHSLVEFKGKWYIFYHTQVLQDAMGIRGGYRSTHVDEVTIAEDGTILPVIPTRKGVEQLKYLNPYQINEAETMAWAGGIATTPTSELSANFGLVNMVVEKLDTGDLGSFVGVSGVDFGDVSPRRFTAKVSSVLDGNVIKVTVDNPTNEAIAYVEVPNTGDLERFVEITVDLDKEITGVHDLFFVMFGKGFYFDAWSFEKY